MEEPSEFIDEQRDSLAGRAPQTDPGWEIVRFDLEDEPADEKDERDE